MTCPPAANATDSGQDHRLLLTVTVDRVPESRIDSAIVGTGTVAAWREMPISPEADGLAIVDVRADEGDHVEKGQVLARLNQSLLLAQIEQNKAAVAEADASLNNALSDLKRAYAVTSGVISKQAIEQRETLVKTTTAKLAVARAILSETKTRLHQSAADGRLGRGVARRFDGTCNPEGRLRRRPHFEAEAGSAAEDGFQTAAAVFCRWRRRTRASSSSKLDSRLDPERKWCVTQR